MKKQFFFVGAILGFSITLIGGYASGSQDCKNVLCLLKTPYPELMLNRVYVKAKLLALINVKFLYRANQEK
jgi:hypothetical protein